MSEEQPTRTSFLGRLGKAFARLLGFVLRLLFTLVIGAALGVGVYFGCIFLYRQYIEPVQVHEIRLDVMDARQEQASARTDQRLDNLQVRLEGQEGQSDVEKSLLADLEARVSAAEATEAAHGAALAHLDPLQAGIDDAQATLLAVQAAQNAIRADIEALLATQDADHADLGAFQADLREIEDALGALQVDVEAAQVEVRALSDTVVEYGQDLEVVAAELSGDQSPAALFRELQLVKAMELLTRSRLLLAQNNIGLARSDIQAGRRLLAALQPEVSADQGAMIGEVIARLDAALAALPIAPVAAADELEGAWQLLIGDLPGAPPVAAGSEGTPTPEATVVVSPTVATTPEATETVIATATITATATVTSTQ